MSQQPHQSAGASPRRMARPGNIDIGGLGSYSDLSTAVNTPFVMTPHESQHDLHEPAVYRPELHETSRYSGRSSTYTIAETDLPSDKKDGKPSDQAIAEEMALKRDVTRHGSLRHSDTSEKTVHAPDDTVLERTEMVDLGKGLEPVIIVDWAPGDIENPFNWPNRRKYTTVWVAVFTTALTALNCTSIAVLAAGGAPAHYGVSRQEYTLAVTMLVFAIANTPLVLAPISEVFGRNMIYQVTSILTMILFIPQAITTNFSAILAIRWFQGMSSSVGNSMVGGTIADIFRAEDRGSGMNIFSVVIFAGQSFGGVFFGWIAMNLGIRWCYWIQAILGAFSCILNAFFLRETRSEVLLSRRARRLTKSTGKLHLCAADLQKQSFSTLFSVSVVRPLKFLVTEPIVTALSAWIGFAWACVFMGGTSVLLVFQQYDWNLGQLGSIQIVVLLGGILGWCTNHHQESLYARSAARNGGKAPPEARLYYAAYGGLAFPLAMFIFAWVGRPEVHWIVPAIMLVGVNWGIYCMYSGVFNYLADAYETYSSSAQAAHSWVRNMVSGIFPLFAHQMYVNLGYPIASTIVACIALLLAAAPLLLLRYGKTLRARSPVTSALEAAAKEQR